MELTPTCRVAVYEHRQRSPPMCGVAAYDHRRRRILLWTQGLERWIGSTRSVFRLSRRTTSMKDATYRIYRIYLACRMGPAASTVGSETRRRPRGQLSSGPVKNTYFVLISKTNLFS